MPDTMLYLSTTRGVYRVDPATGAAAALGPADTSAEALAVAGEALVAAVTPDYGLPMRDPLRPQAQRGAVRSVDGGRTWAQVADGLAGTQVTALAAAGGTLVAGTDPAELLVSRDGGATWRQGQSLREMPGYDRWTYPLPPHTPHVMVIVPHPAEPDVLYAGIEVGGVVRSDDGGATWRVVGSRAPGDVHPDIHGLAFCAGAPHVGYAATPAGVYITEDAGERWTPRNEGLAPRYCRPIVAHPQEPDVAVVVATHGASGFFGIPAERTGGAVFRTEDRGRTWRRVSAGLPDALAPTPAMAADPHAPGRFYLPLFSGAVYVTDDAGLTWRLLAAGLPPLLRAVAV
jgi:photosystem II stability/assembly factor-like uncharacterized protein